MSSLTGSGRSSIGRWPASGMTCSSEPRMRRAHSRAWRSEQQRVALAPDDQRRALDLGQLVAPGVAPAAPRGGEGGAEAGIGCGWQRHVDQVRREPGGIGHGVLERELAQPRARGHGGAEPRRERRPELGPAHHRHRLEALGARGHHAGRVHEDQAAHPLRAHAARARPRPSRPASCPRGRSRRVRGDRRSARSCARSPGSRCRPSPAPRPRSPAGRRPAPAAGATARAASPATPSSCHRARAGAGRAGRPHRDRRTRGDRDRRPRSAPGLPIPASAMTASPASCRSWRRMIACELTHVNCGGERISMDEAAAAAAHWGAEPVMSDMEALMWRSEASPRLRSGGVILDVLDRAPDWDRLEASHLWAVTRVPRLRERVIEDPLRVTPPAWAGDGGVRPRLSPAPRAAARGRHVRRRAGRGPGARDGALRSRPPAVGGRPHRGPARRPGRLPAQAPPLAARRRRGDPAVRHPAQRAARPHAGQARGPARDVRRAVNRRAHRAAVVRASSAASAASPAARSSSRPISSCDPSRRSAARCASPARCSGSRDRRRRSPRR